MKKTTAVVLGVFTLAACGSEAANEASTEAGPSAAGSSAGGNVEPGGTGGTGGSSAGSSNPVADGAMPTPEGSASSNEGSVGAVDGGTQPGDAAPARDASSGQVHCEKLVVSGDPRATPGATWSYESTDDGVDYRLSGVLLAPKGAGPFPAAVVSHGKGGMPGGYSRQIAQKFVPWGLVAIAVGYTHAATDGGLPAGADGASTANIQRGHKAWQLLGCLDYADTKRVVAHGHSMGAFLTGALVGSYPADFKAASHTAGGTSMGPNATPPALAQKIRTPYQIHHGDADVVVALAQDQALDAVLTTSGVEHEFHVYAGVDHAGMSADTTMLDRVHSWYMGHGVLR